MIAKKLGVNSVLWLVILFVILSGCRSGALEYDLIYEGDRLVLNAYVFNKGVIARLTRSNHPQLPLPASFSLAVPGRVWLCDADGVIIAELEDRGDGDFELDMSLATGTGYILKASSDGFDPVVSDVVAIPEPANPLTVNFRGFDPNNNNTFLVDMAFVDIPNRKDIYFWEGHALKNGRKGDFILGYFFNEIGPQCGFYSLFYPDDCFEGQPFQFDCYIERRNMPPNNDSLRIEFGTVHPDYLKYVKSTELTGDLEQIFSEPRPLLSNVNGGYGIVLTKNVTYYDFKL
ncbi:MAG: DUF4249 family protein [Saprospiraceae bacterium]|nr:DUF4249 family protein [Saprospiraceae bacterium]